MKHPIDLIGRNPEKKRVRKNPWNTLPSREKNIMIDLASTMPCYSQMREGWYTASCYESKTRPVCANCRILNRLQKLLEGK